MRLTGIKDLEALNKFLNSPSLPPELTKSDPPDEAYGLQQKPDKEEENPELMRNVSAGSGPTRIAPTVRAAFRQYGPVLACILALLLAK